MLEEPKLLDETTLSHSFFAFILSFYISYEWGVKNYNKKEVLFGKKIVYLSGYPVEFCKIRLF